MNVREHDASQRCLARGSPNVQRPYLNRPFCLVSPFLTNGLEKSNEMDSAETKVRMFWPTNTRSLTLLSVPQSKPEKGRQETVRTAHLGDAFSANELSAEPTARNGH